MTQENQPVGFVNALAKVANQHIESMARLKAEQIKQLRDMYAHEGVSSKTFEYLAFSEDPHKMNSVRLLTQAVGCEYYEVVKFLKWLDGCGFAEFIVGRKGRDTRVLWKFHPQSIGRCAIGMANLLKPMPEDLPEFDADSVSATLTTHQFMLRKDFQLTIDLPVDFEMKDAKRLSAWLSTIPFD